MRFSLATLLLISLFIASLMAVWVLQEPWSKSKEFDRFELDQIGINFTLSQSSTSPDRTRRARVRSEDQCVQIVSNVIDESAKGTIYASLDGEVSGIDFVTDDLIVSDTSPFRNGRTKYILHRRRFPEWWWGHFNRPEVWISIAFGLALIVRAVRSRRLRVVES